MVQEPAPTTPTSAESAVQVAPLPAEQLQQLVAPIALYPDALVAQVLGAATFPDQVAVADAWLQQNNKFIGSSLMQAVEATVGPTREGAHPVSFGYGQYGEE